MYLIKLAFRPWRMALLSQIFSALAVGVLLLLMGFLFWMQQGFKSVLVKLQSEQVMTAYLLPSASEPEETTLTASIQSLLQDQKGVEVKFTGIQEFLKALKRPYPNLSKELEKLGEEINEVVPRYISISGIFPSSVLDSIKKLPGIESVESTKDRYRYVVSVLQTLRWVIRILMVGVSIALFTGLIHLSKMNAYLHQEALNLLRFWGASRSVLLLPGMISGLVVGILGGGIAWGGWATLGMSLARHVRSLSTLFKTLPLNSPYTAIALLIAGGVMGQMAGTLGAYMATRSGRPGGEIGI